jgi:methylated-DNA-[protein]-cysteine S-methyltransferase
LVANALIGGPAVGAGFDVLYRAPFAVLGIRTNGDSVTALQYLPDTVESQPPRSRLGREVIRQIERYLVDPSFRFDLPLEIIGSAFRKRVWEQMCAIPAGQTRTYGELAQRLGSAPRAVGGACGDNKIPLVIPCHRVVARNGIGGFMHTTGDRETGIKRWLLAHESGAVQTTQRHAR